MIRDFLPCSMSNPRRSAAATIRSRVAGVIPPRAPTNLETVAVLTRAARAISLSFTFFDRFPTVRWSLDFLNSLSAM